MKNFLNNISRILLLLFISSKITIISLYCVLYDIIFKSALYRNIIYSNELIKIWPSYFSIYYLYYYFILLKPVLQNLNNNVCFLDIESNTKTRVFIISCDWCSLSNGIIETAKENLIKNPNLINKINFNKLQYLNKNLDNILSKRKTKISYDQTQLWCKNTFGIINDKLILLSFIYLKLELIELRWCPFKRSKKLYYRNKDTRYLEPTEEIIYTIGKILVDHETITCNNCPKIINSNWQYSKSNTLSIFQPLLDFMITEINYDY